MGSASPELSIQIMKPTFATAVLGACLILSGCASNGGNPRSDWIQGRITSIADGVVMPMQIQKKLIATGSATGGIAAQNPKTGEQLEGQYIAMIEAVGIVGGKQFRTRNANAQATLTGDKGTTITFEIQIMTGWSPHGFGQGTDGNNRKYSLQF